MTTRRIRVALVASIWAFGFSAGLGRDAVELESRYAGDGWFEYRLRTLEDPFLTGISFGQLSPYPFTNYVENTLAPHWTNCFYEGRWTGLMYDRSVPQPRLNEIGFAVRSSSRHFRREQHGFQASVYVQFADAFRSGGGEGGFLNLACLAPCAPEEADGSPESLVTRIELVPDITIDELIVTDGQVHGVAFSWGAASIVELQGSHDLGAWATVARIRGDPPHTSWTTNVSLNSFGQFFRLSLVATPDLKNARTADVFRQPWTAQGCPSNPPTRGSDSGELDGPADGSQIPAQTNETSSKNGSRR